MEVGEMRTGEVRPGEVRPGGGIETEAEGGVTRSEGLGWDTLRRALSRIGRSVFAAA